MKKLAAISLVLAMTAASLAGCGSTADTAAPAESEAAETTAATTEETTDTAADTVAADGKVYNIGICQLVQHEALDAATQGFQDALTELLGEENVKFDLQNASGDSATCATIVNQFVIFLPTIQQHRTPRLFRTSASLQEFRSSQARKVSAPAAA